MAIPNLPVCPLMSVGTGIDMVCVQKRCAWYVPNVQKCAMYLMAYDSLLSATEKQKKTK